MHIDRKYKDILIFGEGPTQWLDDTTLAAEVKYPVDFTQSGKIFVWSLHYNKNNSFLFVNATKLYQFEAKDSEIKDYTLCLGNISKYFRIINKKTGLKGTVIQPSLINWDTNEYNQEFHYYSFAVKLDVLEVVILLIIYLIKYAFQIKQKIQIYMFLILLQEQMNQILTNDISCECKCEFDGRKCNSIQKWNNKCQCEYKHICEKVYTWNPATCSCD